LFLRRHLRLFISIADFFEVAALLGACFLVNYVTADAKTNWAEGFVLLSFYTMIVSMLASFHARLADEGYVQVLCTWFYKGETAISNLLTCGTTVAA
jgi:Ca2+:H+ antiporter